MTYLLDADACITYLRVRDSQIERKFSTLQPADVALCSVVKGELLYGAVRSANSETALTKLNTFFDRFVSLPFDDRAAEVYARIRATLAAQGLLIGPNDLLIAAIAVANNLTLVTHNTREFQRVAGLQIEDWMLD